MADLADHYRRDHQYDAPVFHRPHPDARTRHEPFLASLVKDEEHIALVHETDGAVDGFVIAALVRAPPVYDPGGPACLIDDFVVAGPGCGRRWGKSSWTKLVGKLLLAAAHVVASEWFTSPFQDAQG